MPGTPEREKSLPQLKQEILPCFRGIGLDGQGGQETTFRLLELAGWQRWARNEARDLGEIYNWFTEGFDTVDSKEARTLLQLFRCSCLGCEQGSPIARPEKGRELFL
jgi:hypothetical protein